MAKPQFADRTRWLTCGECAGRSYSDPTKPYHYPSCSKYREWRYGPRPRRVPRSPVENVDAVLEDFHREYAGGEEW